MNEHIYNYLIPVKTKVLWYMLILTLFSSCSLRPYYSKTSKNWKNLTAADSLEINYTVYLIGDTGDPNMQTQEPSLKLLQSFIEKDSNSSLIFLGDNIYFDGLPPQDHASRANQEKKINEQLKILQNYKGEVYFIAGNHDWDYMKRDGFKKIKIQEEYIENYLNRGNTFVPDNGCPGPFYSRLQNNVILLAIDSQWWLHKYEKPYGRCADCDAEDEEDFLIQLEDFIKTNRNRHIVIVAHHPLFSNGNHGGYYNLWDYIFPLRVYRPKWYVPLPVVGSIYPLFRKFGGVDQDIAHYRYQHFKNNIENIIKNYDNVVYAAGHDHNLQYIETENIHQIVSGSGSRLNPVSGGGDALYTREHKGFGLVRYYSNGEAWLEFWIPKNAGEEGTLDFRTLLYTRKTGTPESYCGLSEIDYSDSSVVVQAAERYRVSKFKKFLLGNHYRQEWITPVKVPLMNLKTAEGGLIPYGIGGGKQTITLKLRNVDDQEFALRSINKNPDKVVPLDFRNTIFSDLVDDQFSAQHPYGALAISGLADAVKVFHTNPQLVLIPNDSCLGPYKEQFENMLTIFEEDPDENHANVASLGYSKNIIGTDKMRDNIETDEDNILDERNFARARLLDMFIGDWDRYERQYRWATIKTKKGNLYKPVPEDRDQAFFKFDGLLPQVLGKRLGIPSLINFEKKIKDISGLNNSANNMDRRFLSSLTRNDWKSIADSMRNELSDNIIDSSIHKLPTQVFDIHGPEIISKLKSRREQLSEVAEDYYLLLAKYVNVFGTDKREKFNVDRINNEETKVTVYKINKEGEEKEKIYERLFYKKETKEIRLYGLGGEDQFIITGKARKGIKIRILGGEGKDNYSDHSSNVIGKKLIIYDTREENTIEKSPDTKAHLSDLETIHYPNQDKFYYNVLGPEASLYYNPDDGFFIGGGFSYKTYKFRQNPYGAKHKFLISRATQTGSTRLLYQSDIKGFIGNLDLGTNFEMYTPAYFMNYFGYGNESVKTDDPITFNRVRLQQTLFNPSLNKSITRFLVIGLGPKYQYFRLEKNENTFVSTLTPENSNLYSSRHYGGLRGFFRLGTRDNDNNPTRGILLTGEANLNKRVDAGGSYSQYLSEFSFYISPNLPFQLTFAARFGGAVNYGDYEFYQANFLGSTTGLSYSGGNLRGFRKTRFVGDKSLYQNLEVRAELFKFNTYIFPGKFGILALLDNGRVWARNEISKKWHTGYGGGIWFDIFHRIIISSTYSFSNEDSIFNIRWGFFF